MLYFNTWDLSGNATRILQEVGTYETGFSRTVTDSGIGPNTVSPTSTYIKGGTTQQNFRSVEDTLTVDMSFTVSYSDSGTTNKTAGGGDFTSRSGASGATTKQIRALTSVGYTVSYTSADEDGVKPVTSNVNNVTFTDSDVVYATCTSESSLTIPTGTILQTQSITALTAGTSTREGVGFSYGEGGKTETFLTTFTDTSTAITYIEVDGTFAGTNTVEVGFPVGSTSSNGPVVVTVRDSGMVAKEETVQLLMSHGAPNVEYAWELTYKANEGELDWDNPALQPVDGKFSELYQSRQGAVIDIGNPFAYALLSYKVPTYNIARIAVGTALRWVYGGVYTEATGTATASSLVTRTHSVDRGDLDTYQINSTLTGYSYSIEGRYYDEESKWATTQYSSTLDIDMSASVVSVFWGSHSVTRNEVRGVRTVKPVFYSVFETYESVGATYTRLLGMSYEEMPTMVFSQYTTTVPVWTGSGFYHYSLATYSFSGNYMDSVEYSASVDLTVKYVDRRGPQITHKGLENDRMDFVAGDTAKGYYKWKPLGYEQYLYGGFIGSTQGNYDNLVQARSITLEKVAGLDFGYSLEIADLSFQYLDVMNRIRVLALDTGRTYLGAYCTYSISANGGELKTKTEILVTFSTTVQSVHRLYGNTYTGASIDTAKYELRLDSILPETYYTNYPLMLVHSNDLNKGFVASGGGISKANGLATIYVNQGHVTYAIFDSSNSVAGNQQEIHNPDKNTASFVLPANKAVIISAEPHYTVGYYGVDGNPVAYAIAHNLYNV